MGIGDGFAMLSPVLVGLFAGKWLDEALKTFPLCTISLTMLGVFTGIWSIIKKAYKK